MRRYLLFLLALPLCAAPTVTVSATAQTLLGTNQTISLTVDLVDPNNTGLLRVNGTAIVPIMTASTVTPGATATVGPIYGNDVIRDGFGNLNSTYYRVRVFTVINNIISSTAAFQQFFAFTGAGTVDLATATPLAPSFMTGTNGSVVIPGALTASGNSTFTGNNTHSGTETFTGPVSVKTLSNSRVVDGTSYACSDVGLNAAIADTIASDAVGGTVYARCPGTNTIAATVNVGSATANVTLVLLGHSTWNCTINNAAQDCWFVFANSGIEGVGHGANFQQLTIGAAASVRSIVKTFSHVTPAVATHFTLKDLEIHNQSSGTIANAVVDIQGAYDSSFWNLTIDKFSGRGLWIHDFTSPAGGNSLSFYNLLVDGQSTAGARPIVIEENNSGSNPSAIHFTGGDWGHPGAGQFLVEINGHGLTGFGQIDINGIYGESNSSDTTTALVQITDASQVHFSNTRFVKLPGGSTAYCLSLTQTSGNKLFDITAANFECTGGTGAKGIINNQAASFTMNASTIPFYAYETADAGGQAAADTSQIGGAIFRNDGNLELVNPGQFANTGGAVLWDETANTVGYANKDACYGDSTAHLVRCAFNNGSFGPLVTAAPCTTSQKTETAADANVLTCAIPSQAGSYRIRFIMGVSAANTATLGWTASWTDANGIGITPTNLALFQQNVAAPALTWAVGGVAEFYGEADVDVNNGGTPITVKLTFSGTSFTAKVSATVERII